MPLEGFLTMLATRENTLIHPYLWEDPYESVIQNSVVDVTENRRISIKEDFHTKNWYGQCWSYTQESDGLWRNFTHNKEVRCVKIQTTIDALKRSLHKYSKIDDDFYMGDVAYGSPLKEEFPKTVQEVIRRWEDMVAIETREQHIHFIELALLMTKREAFRYENEFRLIVYRNQPDEEANAWSYDINVNSFIKDVEFDPWTKPYQEKNFKKLIKDLGYNGPARTSPLYAEEGLRDKKQDDETEPFYIFKSYYPTERNLRNYENSLA